MAEDAKRMDRTVMVVGLSTRADERDVFEFFSGRAGTVKDVQIIRDARTGKSKGVCFVEFSTAEGMVKSLSMTGQTIKGARVQVQQSQVAEGRGTHASRGKF
ncbi:RNA-binding protein rsd1 [Durusdinium trenchii]|eukprot:g24030.t1